MIVSDEPADLDAWLGTELGFIAAFCRFDGEPVRLEPYQTAFLQNRSRFRLVTRARQVGLSWLLALEALARCRLRESYTPVFVSHCERSSRSARIRSLCRSRRSDRGVGLT